ncbi:hypothetical protein BG006_010077 [Podila minutissima]|uniref:Uncharacterized protein n=1 Tax=Podila minutissima TaxID=64525 RepID=A0A9P5SHF2_9FUNG|nr:hypothetical protein BG006_010077 [Podila minutissima]
MAKAPRRFNLVGVPVTFEFLLRLLLMTLTLGVLVAVSIPKVKSIVGQANLVSVSMEDSSQIPVPGVLICGDLLNTVDVEMISRGWVFDNGTVGPDRKELVPSSMVKIDPTASLDLRANGDWPKTGKCLTFSPSNLFFAKNVGGRNPNALDTVNFVVQSNETFTSAHDLEQQPIWIGIPSINTMTFIYSEHVLLDKTAQTRYTVQKQNLRMMHAGFFNNTVIGRFILSPDTFFVSKYIDKPSYSWVDLAGALGGMASLAVAVWIFLFGNGKYKSWGIMQRYVLKTSPDSKRFKSLPESTVKLGVVDRLKTLVQRLIVRLNGTVDHDLDREPLQTTAQERRRASTRYSVGASTAVSGAAATSRSTNKDITGEHNTARYSMESSGQPVFYFSEQGAPGSRSLRPLAPIDENNDDSEEQVDELIRLIDLRIDERMWSLERTLSRFYLDGFRLRHYSSIPTQDENLTAEAPVPPPVSRTEYSEHQPLEYLRPQPTQPFQPAGPSTSVLGPYSEGSMSYLIPHQATYSVPGLTQSTPYTLPRPSYPPRPPVEQHYQVVNPSEATRTESNNIMSSEGSRESEATTNSQSNLLQPGFPARRDVRGTIRRAVERLQQEWPHDAPAAHQLYVSRSGSASPSESPPRYN